MDDLVADSGEPEAELATKTALQIQPRRSADRL
jgi:hypothetical protein